MSRNECNKEATETKNGDRQSQEKLDEKEEEDRREKKSSSETERASFLSEYTLETSLHHHLSVQLISDLPSFSFPFNNDVCEH